MIEIQGRFNTALCYTPALEPTAEQQIRTVCDQEAFAGCKIRIMSRKQAMAQLSMAEYSAEMKDVWSSCVVRDTLDESPMAYKPLDEIVSEIGPTAEIIERIRPVYNFKASE